MDALNQNSAEIPCTSADCLSTMPIGLQIQSVPIGLQIQSVPTTGINQEQDTELAAEAEPNNLWVDLQIGCDNNILFACLWADCQQRFIQREEFEAHVDAHLAEYANHLVGVGEETNPVCQVRGCQILVSSTEELSRHLKMHIFHANRQHCGLQAVRERHPNLKSCNFPATSRLCYQGDPLICEWDACYVSFTDINEYVVHIEQHINALDSNTDRNEQGHYACQWSDCHATFKNRASIRCHIQHHSGDKMCACPFCGAFFANTSVLNEHVTRRQPGGNLICRFCWKTFMNETVMRKHAKRHIKQHQCQYCSLMLDTPHDLHRHIQAVHARVKNHFCEYCDRAFYQKSDLNRHLEQHFSKEPHDCKICGQCFRWDKQLRTHMRTHNADYVPSSYQCHFCDSRYRRGSALSKHLVQVHKVEVPAGFSRFQYKKCSDGFYRMQTLRYVHEVEAAMEDRLEEVQQKNLVDGDGEK